MPDVSRVVQEYALFRMALSLVDPSIACDVSSIQAESVVDALKQVQETVYQAYGDDNLSVSEVSLYDHSGNFIAYMVEQSNSLGNFSLHSSEDPIRLEDLHFATYDLVDGAITVQVFVVIVIINAAS